MTSREKEEKVKVYLSGKSSGFNNDIVAAWDKAYYFITTTQPRGARVFEVHHQTMHAREIFFTAILEGATPVECYERAIAPQSKNLSLR